MSKIVILGSTGMLGSAVSKFFINSTNHEVVVSYRNKNVVQHENNFYFDVLETDLNEIPDCDYILNCIGIIKPFMKNNKLNSVLINSVFPHRLSSFCEKNNIKVIHITTDCVFSGKMGAYDEESLHDCEDDYGKTKSLGEPDNCMVLRTSIIGEEVHKNASLIEWVKSNKGGTINGFTEHIWNGVTTKQYADICNQIISNKLYKNGIFHVHSNDVNKFDLLNTINNKFNLNIKINAVKTAKVDRTLRTKKELLKNIQMKSVYDQIMDLD